MISLTLRFCLYRRKQKDLQILEINGMNTDKNILLAEKRFTTTFTKMLDLLTRNMKIAYANPEDKIVQQNEEYNGLVYFVYRGRFIVSAVEYGYSDGR